MEISLVEERRCLWNDFAYALRSGVHERSAIVKANIVRIRHISEALGYPADCHSVPWFVHPWYGLVEHFPEMGMYARDLPDLEESELKLGEELSYPSTEIRDLFSTNFDPDDPDGWDFTV